MPSMFSVLPWIDAGCSAVGKCAAVIGGDATSQYEFRLKEIAFFRRFYWTSFAASSSVSVFQCFSVSVLRTDLRTPCH